MKRFAFLAAVVVASGLGAVLLHAGPPKEWKQTTWKVPKEQFNVIKTVNLAANTVSIHHVGGKIKVDRDLAVTTFTDIIVDGKKTTLASLKVGMHVDYVLSGDGLAAARIEIREEQAPPPTPVATATLSFPSNMKKKPPGQ